MSIKEAKMKDPPPFMILLEQRSHHFVILWHFVTESCHLCATFDFSTTSEWRSEPKMLVNREKGFENVLIMRLWKSKDGSVQILKAKPGAWNLCSSQVILK